MDAREERLVLNETLFREVNERIEDAALTHGSDEHLYEFFCECSNIDCNLRLSLTLGVYENARSDPAEFLVAPGHELPEIEEVVSRGHGYQVMARDLERLRSMPQHLDHTRGIRFRPNGGRRRADIT